MYCQFPYYSKVGGVKKRTNSRVVYVQAHGGFLAKAERATQGWLIVDRGLLTGFGIPRAGRISIVIVT